MAVHITVLDLKFRFLSPLISVTWATWKSETTQFAQLQWELTMISAYCTADPLKGKEGEEGWTNVFVKVPHKQSKMLCFFFLFLCTNAKYLGRQAQVIYCYRLKFKGVMTLKSIYTRKSSLIWQDMVLSHKFLGSRMLSKQILQVFNNSQRWSRI